MSSFEADDWARAQAMRSNEKLSRVRRLIDRVTTGLDPTPKEPPAVTAAITADRQADAERRRALNQRG
ncbi:hypothetical protein ACFTWH_17015 [Streptomyces sp. NPDC057011]|uniref:hypothetical protein n=1 Tax=unclassified Streptomyces TaxID=2593676 RepID=UPI003632822C